jgi:glycosyltransferase involved in cell wall biosynthesis
VNWPYWALSKWLFRRADLLLPVSEDLAAILRSLGAPPDRIRVHPLGVEINVPMRRDRGDDAFIVVMVGRFVEKKGFEYGIRGFASLARSHPAARLIVIGDGPLGPAYRRLIRDLGMAQRVELRPPAAHTDVIGVMRSADVALVPSVTARDGDREGMTMIVKEAGAMGLPVVASRHAGIPEVVDHDVTGLLVDERDATGIAAALDRLLTNAGERRRLGDAGRARIRRDFNHETQMARLESLYDEAVARHANR